MKNLKPHIQSGPLKLLVQINGVPKLQGVYSLKDQEGFPISSSFDIARENGWDIDYIEALCDAGRQSIEKYDGLIEELKHILPNDYERIEQMFAVMLTAFNGASFSEMAANMYKSMHNNFC